MCANCGCAEGTPVTLSNLQTGRHVHLDAEGREYAHEHEHDPGHHHDHDHSHEHHDHDHGHEHHHHHPEDHGGVIHLEQDVLAKNNRLAEQNRGWLEGRGAIAVNIMSSPGAGKTTLLERTIREVGSPLNICVIEGDQETLRDSERIRSAGAPVIQINTGAGCHLDAAMAGRALRQLNPASGSLVLIENVGNLVCPAMFDLGEAARVVVASVTEGDDKPAKYPHMFRAADVIVLNKIDLLPHVKFDLSTFEQTARERNSHAQIFKISATNGDGLAEWYQWLRTTAQAAKT